MKLWRAPPTSAKPVLRPLVYRNSRQLACHTSTVTSCTNSIPTSPPTTTTPSSYQRSSQHQPPHVPAFLPKNPTTYPGLLHQHSTETASVRLHEQFGLPAFDRHIFVVFGYGSIMWKQNFEFDAEYEAYIKGYKRVFYQGSRDHRGVPIKPGRVVTLLPSEDKEQRVYGKAYQLPADPEKLNRIFQALDTREGGYERLFVTLYDAHPPLATGSEERLLRLEEKVMDTSGKPVVCLCYNATEENADYLGPAPMEDMARQILNSTGMSGTNSEYLYNLDRTLRDMGVSDSHVFELAALARQLEVEPAPHVQ